MTDWRGGAGCLVCVAALVGCRPSTVKMQPGVPLEMRRGYCIVETQFKQHGKPLEWDDTMKRLARHPGAGPLVREGNGYAIASIITTIAATAGIVVGSLGKQGEIDMSDGASTALLAGGAGAAIGSWVLCITSDGKYVAAGNKYNAGITLTRPGGANAASEAEGSEGAYEQEETWK